MKETILNRTTFYDVKLWTIEEIEDGLVHDIIEFPGTIDKTTLKIELMLNGLKLGKIKKINRCFLTNNHISDYQFFLEKV